MPLDPHLMHQAAMVAHDAILHAKGQVLAEKVAAVAQHTVQDSSVVERIGVVAIGTFAGNLIYDEVQKTNRQNNNQQYNH